MGKGLWVLVEFDEIDVRTQADSTSKTAPGDVRDLRAVYAASEEDALAEAGGPGWFAAFPMPEELPRARRRLVEWSWDDD